MQGDLGWRKEGRDVGDVWLEIEGVGRGKIGKW